MTSLKLALALFALALASSAAAAADIKVINADAWFPEGPIWYRASSTTSNTAATRS